MLTVTCMFKLMKKVQGNGDQGPPDGWCYEGRHTTDLKRARFRADSTLLEDKLISCRRKRCFGEQGAGEGRGRSKRTAARKKIAEEESEEEEEEGFDDKEIEREAKALVEDAEPSTKGKGKKKSASVARRLKEDAMDVEEGAQTEPKAAKESVSDAKPAGKVSRMKRKDMEEDTARSDLEASSPVAKEGTASISSLKPKSKVQRMKPKPLPKSVVSSPPAASGEADTNMEDGEGAAVPQADSSDVKSKPKKPRRPRKSAADGGKYVPPKIQAESTDPSDEDERKPKRKKRKST